MENREPDAFNNVRQLWPYELGEQISFASSRDHECDKSREDIRSAKNIFDRLVDMKTRRIRSAKEARYPDSTFVATFLCASDDVSELITTVAKHQYHNQVVIQDIVGGQERGRVKYEALRSDEGVTRTHYTLDAPDAARSELASFGGLFQNHRMDARLQNVSFEEIKALVGLIYRSVSVDTGSSQAGITRFPFHDSRIGLDEDFEELVATGYINYSN